MATDYSDQCSVAVRNSYSSCGTITRASIDYATSSDVADIFKSGGNWRDMTSMLATSLELKACGIPVNGLHDFLMSSAKSVGGLINKRSVKGSDSMMEPFILAKQKSVINVEYWAITNGWATGDYSEDEDLDLTGATRVVRVVSRYGVDMNAADFVPGATVHIHTRTSGTSERGQWKVIDSEVDDAGAYVDVSLASQNAGSSDSFDSTPTDGLLLVGTNNINDYESWCHNRAARNPMKIVPFWTQTSRYSLCVDQNYKEWLAKMLQTNEHFRLFGDVDLAERNKQLGAAFQREWVNSFFWGKPISANQTLANWQSLDAVNTVTSSTFDTGTEGKLVAYKANAIGIFEQLRGCGQTKDLQNQTLNLLEFFEDLYDIKRQREALGRPSDSIDVYTDSRTASQIDLAMFQYYNTRTEGGARYVVNQNSSGQLGSLGFHVNSYKLKFPVGVTLNVLTSSYFDDFQSAAEEEDIGSVGRFLMVLDLGGSIYPGIVKSNRKVHTTGQLEDLAKIDSTYACVMENFTREVTLNSLTWTAICECPSASIIYHNFNDHVPASSSKSTPYTDGYTTA